MNSVLLIICALIFFILGYRFYSKYVSVRLGINNDIETPAHTLRDGVDYVPARAPVLLGHHFASIAGAAPIIGPIAAASFGWIPVYFWIVLGGIFIGAVHDFSSLVASVRHRGRSIGEVIEEHVGLSGKRLFLIFAWATLILVIAAFTIIVAKTFNRTPEAGSASILFILLAIIFGFVVYRRNVPLSAASVIGLALLIFCIYLGILFPLQLSVKTWTFILLVYIIAASVVPVWILLQPRDYLNSFLLYILVAGAFIGILILQPAVKYEGYTSFNQDIGYLFPILFVTVACGAISGFHSLVASGTTAKQLNRESDARIVGYGGMLIESFLSVIAITTVIILTKDQYQNLSSNPVGLFSEGVGSFFSGFGFPHNIGVIFTSLAVSAFALTSLDTATRLGRYTFQEFFTKKGSVKKSVLAENRYIATIITVLPAAVLALSGKWQVIWPLFGSANQMLAALALIAVTVWLGSRNVKSWFTIIPMIFMFIVTISALFIMIADNFEKGQYLLSFLSLILFVVAVIQAFLAYKKVRMAVRDQGSRDGNQESGISA